MYMPPTQYPLHVGILQAGHQLVATYQCVADMMSAHWHRTRRSPDRLHHTGNSVHPRRGQASPPEEGAFLVPCLEQVSPQAAGQGRGLGPQGLGVQSQLHQPQQLVLIGNAVLHAELLHRQGAAIFAHQQDPAKSCGAESTTTKVRWVNLWKSSSAKPQKKVSRSNCRCN